MKQPILEKVDNLVQGSEKSSCTCCGGTNA